MVRAAIPTGARGTMVLLHLRHETNDRHWILRAKGRSGKGRWIARLVVLILVLAILFLFLLFLGRPIEPRMIEVDVTDKIAESLPSTRDAR
ncbi:hypothetical protein ATE71_14795 [Sphingopyxis sp. H115]|nr:hypothetical protein ATE71_14795 [Sphingopyxis sp. H115]